MSREQFCAQSATKAELQPEVEPLEVNHTRYCNRRSRAMSNLSWGRSTSDGPQATNGQLSMTKLLERRQPNETTRHRNWMNKRKDFAAVGRCVGKRGRWMQTEWPRPKLLPASCDSTAVSANGANLMQGTHRAPRTSPNTFSGDGCSMNWITNHHDSLTGPDLLLLPVTDDSQLMRHCLQ